MKLCESLLHIWTSVYRNKVVKEIANWHDTAWYTVGFVG